MLAVPSYRVFRAFLPERVIVYNNGYVYENKGGRMKVGEYMYLCYASREFSAEAWRVYKWLRGMTGIKYDNDDGKVTYRKSVVVKKENGLAELSSYM